MNWMFLFGQDRQSQVRGVISFCLVLVIIAIVYVAIGQPWGSFASKVSLNTEILTALIGFAGLLAGYLAGDAQGNGK
jgi:hypothetical protein